MKNHRLLLFIYLLICVLCLNCTGDKIEKPDLDQLNIAITELDNAWNNMDIEKIVGIFAEDATYLTEDSEMLKGQDAIRQALEAYPKTAKNEFNRDKVEVKIESNMAYEIVNQTITFQNKDEEAQTEINKYIHIWKKQNDGTWRVLIDMVNRRTPPCE